VLEMTIAGHAAMRFWLRPGGLATTTTRGFSVFFEVARRGLQPKIAVEKGTRSARRLWSCHACVLHAVVVIP
jgi:hypothetical protein